MAKTKSAKSKASNKEGELKTEITEKVAVKQLLKDERTHKIAGAVCMLIAFILFFAFTSYLFTWNEDQDKVINQGARLLLANDVKVNNLLGTLGAFISHFFFFKGFGVASYLLCTSFFTISINLFFGRKVFSIARNIKYVIIGLVVLSVAFAVIFSNNGFPWGGAVGTMIRDWMYAIIGKMGTLAILFVAVFSYIIWRFNPVFKMPAKKQMIATNENQEASLIIDKTAEKIDLPVEPATTEEGSGNILKGNAGMVSVPSNDKPAFSDDIKIFEKENAEITEMPVAVSENVSVVKEMPLAIEPEEVKPAPKTKAADLTPLELEIKSPDKIEDEALPVMSAVQKVLASKPYDPVLDLKDYKYPTLDLLENHGSDKIVQDANELENNKNQIINTLKNYDITIQKISATVGPTVTLYEIIPAAGVRISRIKNLEDDIALSLAALGIRIIAPIPGKGTIGIEVPNAKKSYRKHEDIIVFRKIPKQ